MKILLFLFFSLFLFSTIAAAQNCSITLPSISFIGSSTRLSVQQQQILQVAAKSIRNNPGCNFSVVGYCSYSKYLVQRGALRVNAVIKYLVEKQGIRAERLIPVFGEEGGDCPTVDLRVMKD